MREIKRHTPKNWALIELVIVILFFALSAAIVTECFATAKLLSDKAESKTAGLIAAQDIIEKWSIDPLKPLSNNSKNTLTLYYDNDMHLLSDENDAAYILTAASKSGITPTGELADITVTINDSKGEELVNLYSSEYLPSTEI